MQAGWHPGCTASYLGAGTCDITCKRCTPCAGYDYCHNCRDAPPGGSNFTCAQQARPPAGAASLARASCPGPLPHVVVMRLTCTERQLMG